jgi:pimeloyl-ACP methyl ester carboxylesterase
VLRPAWLRRLVLVDCAGLDVPEAPIADLFTLTPAERTALTRYRPEAAVEAEPADEETLRRMAKNQTTFARLSWQPYLVDIKLRGRLHRIDAPTLVLWGEGDRLIPVRHGEVAASEIRGARLLVVPEAGHNPLRDQPEICAREIRALLGQG